MLSGNVTLINDLQPQKALSPIIVIVSGIVTLFNDEQYPKAHLPIFVIL